MPNLLKFSITFQRSIQRHKKSPWNEDTKKYKSSLISYAYKEDDDFQKNIPYTKELSKEIKGSSNTFWDD